MQKEFTATPQEQAPPPKSRSGGCLRTTALVFLALFAIFAALAAFLAVSTAYTTKKTIVEPVQALVQGVLLQATPVILPDPVTIVREINDMARLETASVSMEKLVSAEQNNEMLWGALGETMIFVAYGDVIAGVDMAKIEVDDLQVVDPTTVMVNLPDVEVLVTRLDNERSYVADRDTGLLLSVFGNSDPQLETQVRQIAEQEILAAALAGDLLQRADANAHQYMQDFLVGLGFEDVIFTDGPPPIPEPYQQDAPKGFVIATPVP
ncbi:MAG: DUF4230 domain-containing protein [Anaerolineae bacterium]|nr:DUF4230 domain-containing protein [Anaerolineae bacterium]MCO5205977.1 DUF4230 domain-containing protein [Anaerolineae bacterium]